MNKKRLLVLKEDWLAGNAVVAFLGALMTAQSWKLSEGGTKISLIITKLTIPAFPDAVYLALGAFLFVSSIILATASVVPPLRSRVIHLTGHFSMGLAILILAAFIVSCSSALAELPSDQWWFVVLLLGGLAFLLFLIYRLFGAALQSMPTEDGSKDAENE